MNNRFKALTQERADLIKEQKSLFDGAATTLTDEQKQRDDAIVARLDVLAGDLAREERQRKYEREAPAVQAYTPTLDRDSPEGLAALQANILAYDQEAHPSIGRSNRSHARRSGKATADDLFAKVPWRVRESDGSVTLPGDISGISGGDMRAAVMPFQTFGENLMAAMAFEKGQGLPTAYRQYEANTWKIVAATGLNQQVGSEGGILVQTDFIAGLLTPLHETGPFTSVARNIPVSADSNGVVLNAVDETSRLTGSRWGGVQGYRIAEAGTILPTMPKFRRMELRLKKYGVLAYSTDELLKNTAALESVITQAAGEELSFMANDDLLNGLGAFGPLGALNAGGANKIAIQIAIESGQSLAASALLNANLNKMWKTMLARYRANAVWYINAELEPWLDVLTIPAGVAAIEPRYVNYGPDGVMRIKGKPVVVTEFNAAPGTVGDIVLANFADDYVTIDKGGVQYATSIHVQFVTDQTAFRFIYLYDGQPTLNGPVTPYKGTAGFKQSAYVALAARV